MFDNITNLDLLSVAITCAAIGILGFTVFFSNRKNITNKSFLLFSIATILYSTSNYLQYQLLDVNAALWVLRLTIFFAVWHAFSFFQLFYVFPEEKKVLPHSYRNFLVPLVTIGSIITLTPLVLMRVQEVSGTGRIVRIENGPAIALFGILVVSLILSGIIVLIRKTYKAQAVDRKPFRLVSIGAFITFALILTFNFILPAILGNSRFITLAPVFFFPFVAFTFYAIYKHKLFNIRVVATSTIAFLITIFSFINIVYSTELSEVVINATAFLIILLGSIQLIRAMFKLEEAKESLQIANEGQENLIHVMNHQIKGYLAKSRDIFSELMEEPAYGPVSTAAKPMLQEGFKSLTEGVKFVQEILTGSSAQSGAIQYNMAPIDMRKIVEEQVEKERSRAGEKKLDFEFIVEEGDYSTKGDGRQLSEAVRNLIDNSIIYTPSGQVKINLSKNASKITLCVQDTGMGIAEEDKARLFTKGGKGKDSSRINVNSSGYGLAFVKGVVEAHSGRVWAESAGPGKGSTFYIELPVK